eukprot:GHUV01024648.1.p1 GENE.GHUV01024648.1~~GHUV01024648.1.p1  ORF type:complete len:242 (-),score=28.69 GHUV01024648.1:447-1172(-)
MRFTQTESLELLPSLLIAPVLVHMGHQGVHNPLQIITTTLLSWLAKPECTPEMSIKLMSPFLLSCLSSTAFKLRHMAQSPSYRYFTSHVAVTPLPVAIASCSTTTAYMLRLPHWVSIKPCTCCWRHQLACLRIRTEAAALPSANMCTAARGRRYLAHKDLRWCVCIPLHLCCEHMWLLQHPKLFNTLQHPTSPRQLLMMPVHTRCAQPTVAISTACMWATTDLFFLLPLLIIFLEQRFEYV